MHKRRILVTGASGLLGLNTAVEAAKAHEVIGQVNRHPLRTEAFTIVQADLLAPGALERLLDQTQPEWVIHCAALANVDACENDPLQARQLNSEVPRRLAELVARGGARLLHVSTDAVFDGQRGGYTEEDAPHPLGTYAQTKLDGELGVLASNPEGTIGQPIVGQVLVARVNLFGWSLSGTRSLAEFFFTKLSAGQPCMGFTDVFFCPMLANDLGLVFLKMLDLGLSGLYHAVGCECISKYEFGLQVARRFGLDESLIAPKSVLESGLKAARSPNLTLRTNKLAQALGQPLPGLSTGLDRFYTLYQQGYPHWINQIQKD